MTESQILDKSKFTRTSLLCKALGWQGGTIHQVAEETGCQVHDLLYGTYQPMTDQDRRDYDSGWFAYATCSLEHNRNKSFPKYKGNLCFWYGVIRSAIVHEVMLRSA